MTPLDWALRYVERGWPIMPCHWMIDGRCSCGRADCASPGKHPRPRKGVHDATTRDHQIDGWWRSIWPDANIGIATGQVSGLYVIDLDGADAIGEWAALELQHGDAPTLTCRTGGGGKHLYFQLPPRIVLPNTAKRIGPRIDSRGTGGYVLAPPSNHRSGQHYEWVNWPTKPAPLPDWVVSILARPEERRAPAPIRRATQDDPVALRILDEEARIVAGTQPGSRNEQLFKSACSVLSLAYGGDVAMAAALAAMLDAGMASGLPKHEVEKTVQSAVEAARETPRRIRTRQLGGAA